MVCDVLGEMAFMVSDDEPADPPADASWLEAEIRYLGPVEAILRCRCTGAFARELTANLLCLDAESCSEDEANDGLREFMNVLCGQLVTAWHGREAVFNLSIPDVHAAAAPEDGDSPTCRLCVSGTPLFFWHSQA
ncbi:MAG: hypothetical protein D6744_00745 [Planctomycetota bacterium]|nr:MAG: hypothetical protein D6744_00745 [Planctomycetota bacterium]